MPYEVTEVMGATADEDVRHQRLEDAWQRGELFGLTGVFADQNVNPASNALVAGMVRDKIRGIVDDPAVAEALCPTTSPVGTTGRTRSRPGPAAAAPPRSRRVNGSDCSMSP